ncbi:hypothetical protein [Flavobacterium sp.]|uniref:hypothetical protein n=1 Tax=Flavobacterium sp. TaxID=239 RepID=UPI0025FB503F|nr:hypothetical protein [Flavobacterium sp.]
MKRIISFCYVLFLVCFVSSITLVSCKSKKSIAEKPTTKTFEKAIKLVKPEEVEEVKKDRAYDIGKRLLESCNTSRFKTFNNTEATDKVRQNATREKISAICKKINQRNGRFLNINLIDISFNKKTKEHIFRYSIGYEKKLYKRELFVTINTLNQVSAISTKEVSSKPL